MTYSEPTPEQEIGGQESTEESTQQESTESTEQQSTDESAAEDSGEPGKKQGDPLFAETEGGSAAGDESTTEASS